MSVFTPLGLLTPTVLASVLVAQPALAQDDDSWRMGVEPLDLD